MSKDIILDLLSELFSWLTRAIIVIAGILFCAYTLIMGYTRLCKEPDTYVLQIQDKSLDERSTRSGTFYAPTLHFELETGEEITVKVNSESYENVEVGDYVAVDVWKVFGETTMTELNPIMNNVIPE